MYPKLNVSPNERTEILVFLFLWHELSCHYVASQSVTKTHNSTMSQLPTSSGTCCSDLYGDKCFLEPCTVHLISITDPWQIHSSLPSDPTGQRRTLLTWAFTLSCSSLTAYEPMPRQFVDFRPRFNTIIPELLQTKPSQLTVPDPICWWITSFPTGETHQVKLEEQMSNTSSAVTYYCFSYSTPVADLFVKPKVYWQHNCSAVHIALFIMGEESACRHEVEQLAVRFRQINLALNSVKKTVKMRGEFRRSQSSSYLAS